MQSLDDWAVVDLLLTGMQCHLDYSLLLHWSKVITIKKRSKSTTCRYLVYREAARLHKENREKERREQEQFQHQHQRQQVHVQHQQQQLQHYPEYAHHQQQQQHSGSGAHREELAGPMPVHTRPAGDVSEGPPVKKKPSALDRVALAEQEAMDTYAGYHGSSSSSPSPARSQSPSRRSPRSPPCTSPSTWHKYRGSPPRSPPIRVMSPKSPTERYPPDVYDNVDIPDDGNYFTYESAQNGGFVRPPDGPLVRGPDGQYVPDKPPPKPARMSNQYEFQVYKINFHLFIA